ADDRDGAALDLERGQRAVDQFVQREHYLADVLARILGHRAPFVFHLVDGGLRGARRGRFLLQRSHAILEQLDLQPVVQEGQEQRRDEYAGGNVERPALAPRVVFAAGFFRTCRKETV